MYEKNVFLEGWRSVKANAVPLAVLWVLAFSLVWAFYHLPGVARLLEPLSLWQTACGWSAAFSNRVVFCGVVPGIFLFSVKTIRPRRPMLTVAAYCLWGGCWGIACDAFFTFQACLFGTGTDLATLVKKVSVDQLVWNVFVCTPVNALFFPWVARDFRPQPRPSLESYGRTCLVILVSNWMVWIPVEAVVYAFPLPLQIQLVGLASSFWMLVALQTAAKGGVR